MTRFENPYQHMKRLDEEGTAYALTVGMLGATLREYEVMQHGPTWVQVRNPDSSQNLAQVTYLEVIEL
jgi:hypothetical protein